MCEKGDEITRFDGTQYFFARVTRTVVGYSHTGMVCLCHGPFRKPPIYLLRKTPQSLLRQPFILLSWQHVNLKLKKSAKCYFFSKGEPERLIVTLQGFEGEF